MNHDPHTATIQAKPSSALVTALGVRHDFLLCCSRAVLPIQLSPLLEDKSHLTLKCEDRDLRIQRSFYE